MPERDIAVLGAEAFDLDAGGVHRWLERLVSGVAPQSDSCTVRLVDDGTMTELNQRYRGLDQTTDVLSFPGERSPEGMHLGDIVVSVPQAERQARTLEHGLSEELQLLLLHGVLHCLGLDHETDDGEMELAEDALRHRWVDSSQHWRLVAADDGIQAGGGAEAFGAVRDGGDGVRNVAKVGTVALIGRPNAGKSTLLNSLLGEKLAIVSDKPQTTRQRLMGILTEPRGQLIFYDTPGIHKPQFRMNRRMVQEALETLDAADVVVLVTDASVRFGSGDQYLIDLVCRSQSAKIVAVNKIDLVSKPKLLPLMARYAEAGLDEIVPLSALEGDGIEQLLELAIEHLPAGEALYDPELLTVHTERFLVAERIREKILEQTRDELPFATAVLIDRWREDPESSRLHLSATILVEKPGQKRIVIGQGGKKIKAIGIAARQDLQEYLERPVHLELFVREEPGWRENPRILGDLERETLVLPASVTPSGSQT